MLELYQMADSDDGNTGGGSGSGDNGPGDDGGKDDSTAVPDWMGSLSDDLLTNENLQGFKSVEDLARSHVDLSGKTVLEVPKAAADYELDFGDAKLSDDQEANIREMFLEIGLSNDQAQRVFEAGVKDATRQREASVSAYEKQVKDVKAALTNDWGDDYEANIDKANQAVVKLFPESFVKYMNDTEQGQSLFASNEGFIRGMYAIATKISEDKLESGDGDGGSSDKSAAEILYGKTHNKKTGD